MRNNKGFALPIVLVAIVVMSITAVALLHTSIDEAKSARAIKLQTTTFFAAEAALGRAVTMIPGTLLSGDSVKLGPWDFGPRSHGEVTIHRIDGDTLDISRMYLLSAHGFGDQGLFGDAYLDQVVTVNGRFLWDVYAGMVALGGLKKNGASGTISGFDVCGASVAGVLAPDSSVVGNTGVADGTEPWLEGDPSLEYNDNAVTMLGFGEWSYVRSMSTTYHIYNGTEWTDSSVTYRRTQSHAE